MEAKKSKTLGLWLSRDNKNGIQLWAEKPIFWQPPSTSPSMESSRWEGHNHTWLATFSPEFMKQNFPELLIGFRECVEVKKSQLGNGFIKLEKA